MGKFVKSLGLGMMYAGIAYFVIVPVAALAGVAKDEYAASTTICIAGVVALCGVALWSLADDNEK